MILTRADAHYDAHQFADAYLWGYEIPSFYPNRTTGLLKPRTPIVPRDLCDEPEFDLHPCPGLVEIYGDTETLCSCCVSCATECARDV